MEPNGIEGIDPELLEKRLEGLRDTQESVQGLSLWCQSNKRHSNTITDTWLKVLRRSPVEKRLTMFYLANDVVQHAKRKSDVAVVNQWAFAVQKAVPHVRTPSSVSSAISRIFKIWEERGVYSKEAVADLLSLLNNVSSKEKVETKKPETYTANAEKVSAFQPSLLITKIKLASRLKSHLGTTFRTKSYYQMDMDVLKNSIKDRQHGQEVIQEMGALLEQLRTSEQKLQTEVDERRKIVETAEIAIVFYENVRSESEIVNSAYKSFTARIMKAKEAVDSKLQSFEDMEKEPSPCPSPPIAAPSPEEDDGFLMTHSHIPSFQSHTSSSGNNNNSSMNLENLNSSSIIESVMSSQDFSRSSSSSNSSNNINSTPNIPHNNSNNNNNANISLTNQPLIGSSANNNDSSSSMSMAIPSWVDYMSYQMQHNLIPQNFSMSPSMQLQMQMQQQHLQQYGYPPTNKYDQPDIGSIPLPPQNISLGPQNPPPLPSPSSSSSASHEIGQYPPPLPPQPDVPPQPTDSMPIPVYQPPLPLPVDNQVYTSQNSQDENIMYQNQTSQSSDNMYENSQQQQQQQETSVDQMYQPQNSSLYPISTSEENVISEYQSQQQQPLLSQPPQQLLSPQAVQQQQQYEPSSSDISGHSGDFEFNEYEPAFVDSQNQQNFLRQQHHYSPKTPNFHPYNPSNRSRHPGPRSSGPRNINPTNNNNPQPLMSPPIQNSPHPRFQPRNPMMNANSIRPPRMLRLPIGGGGGESFSNNNNTSSSSNNNTTISPVSQQKIPSLLDTPVSPRGNPMIQQRPNLPKFGAGDSNGTDDNYQYDQKFEFQKHLQQQQNRSFEDGRGGFRGRGGGFRGGFRGAPRMRGIGPGGPRRGRY